MADELDVRWLMFENVRGLLTARGPDGVPGSALELIRQKLLQAGFQTQVSLLNAADYGVPQRRVRLVVFGFRVGDQLNFPKPSRSKDGQLPWVSMGDALSSLGALASD
jgi:DNA (cytosine-5)-methyltransferase 1